MREPIGRLVRAALAGVTVALVLVGCSGGESGRERFFAVMTPTNVVPTQPAPNSSGNASFTVSGSAIDYSVQVQSITGVTRVAIFSGDAGVNGTAVAELYSGGPSGPIAAGTIVTGGLVAANIQGMALDSLLVLMRGSHAYIQVHTQSLPNGEIRGQISPN
jgi:CHRD domain-containing protein